MTLGRGEDVPDRPFADAGRSDADAAVMARMLERLRAHVAAVLPDPTAPAGRFDRFTDDLGGHHKIVLPALERAHRAGDLFAVGFFGQARADVDHGPIVALEGALIDDMPGTPGLVAYYNTFHPDAGWGNLVLFESEAAKDGWGSDPRHAEAVRRSPTHYHSVRLHNARAIGGLRGTGGIELIRTRYLDFGGPTAWRATRTYA